MRLSATALPPSAQAPLLVSASCACVDVDAWTHVDASALPVWQQWILHRRRCPHLKSICPKPKKASDRKLDAGTNDLTQMTFGFSRDDMGTFLPTYLEQVPNESKLLEPRIKVAGTCSNLEQVPNESKLPISVDANEAWQSA